MRRSNTTTPMLFGICSCWLGLLAIAAVLYVFRCLVQDNIPLNEGCLKPLHIIIPPGSMLNPQYPAAVVAGNVETSQYVVHDQFAFD